MANIKNITVEQIEPLINEFKGNISAIANRLGVDRATVYSRIEKSATLQDALKQAREAMIDNAESSLYRKVVEGDVTATIFFLKTQGRSRGNGYNERMEITGKDGGPIAVNDVALTAAIEKLAQWQKED